MADDAKFLEVKAAPQGGLQFVLGNGKRVMFDPARCTKQIRAQAELHGFNQKIRDGAAGFSKGKDYDGAAAEMQEIIDALYNGDWKRQGGGTGGGLVLEDIAAAIAAIRKADPVKALAAVQKATTEQRKEWMKNATVAAGVAKAKADRLAKAAEAATGEGADDGLKGLEL